MQKIVINKRYGGFGLSHEGVLEYFRQKGQPVYTGKNKWLGDFSYSLKPLAAGQTEPEHGAYWYDGMIERNDPALVATVEKLGDVANGWAARLRVVEVPDGVEWNIIDYDGVESVHQVHEVWY